ncbi:hypothetical protein BDD12DRAFT_808911 [Trichophaea hybrida]|nr:hypothetical protein BDD12DRAFT_808911 [Trichophaea hybrida]
MSPTTTLHTLCGHSTATSQSNINPILMTDDRCIFCAMTSRGGKLRDVYRDGKRVETGRNGFWRWGFKEKREVLKSVIEAEDWETEAVEVVEVEEGWVVVEDEGGE